MHFACTSSCWGSRVRRSLSQLALRERAGPRAQPLLFPSRPRNSRPQRVSPDSNTSAPLRWATPFKVHWKAVAWKPSKCFGGRERWSGMKKEKKQDSEQTREPNRDPRTPAGRLLRQERGGGGGKWRWKKRGVRKRGTGGWRRGAESRNSFRCRHLARIRRSGAGQAGLCRLF